LICLAGVLVAKIKKLLLEKEQLESELADRNNDNLLMGGDLATGGNSLGEELAGHLERPVSPENEELQRLKDENEELQNSLEEAQEKLKELIQAEIKKAEQNAEAASEIANLTEQLTETKEELTKVERLFEEEAEENLHSKNQIEDLERQLDQRKEQDDYNLEKNEYDKEIGLIKSQLKETTEERDKKHAKIHRLQKKI
jgi:chromosome segregation ATPase